MGIASTICLPNDPVGTAIISVRPWQAGNCSQPMWRIAAVKGLVSVTTSHRPVFSFSESLKHGGDIRPVTDPELLVYFFLTSVTLASFLFPAPTHAPLLLISFSSILFFLQNYTNVFGENLLLPPCGRVWRKGSIEVECERTLDKNHCSSTRGQRWNTGGFSQGRRATKRSLKTQRRNARKRHTALNTLSIPANKLARR